MIKTGALESTQNQFTNIYDNSWEKISVINGEKEFSRFRN